MGVTRAGIRFAILGTAAACVVSLLSPMAATAAGFPGAIVTENAVPDAGVSPEQIAEQVAEVPAEMRAAIERDLGISTEEYVEQALAAAAVVDTVDALQAAGIATLGSTVADGAGVVYVADDHAADAVEAAGLQAIVGAPPTYDASALEFELMEDVRGGSGYVYSDGTSNRRCSLGFAGFAVASGAQQALTAGHCMGDASAPRRILPADAPNRFRATSGDLGTPVLNSYRLGDGYDHGLIAANAAHSLRPEVLTWGGGTGAPLASAPLVVRDATRAVVGAPICRSGSTTGWRCGEIMAVDAQAMVSGHSVNAIIASVCSRGGDSGGAAVSGTTAVGITSGGTGSGECAADDITVFSQLYSAGAQSADGLYAGGWEPSVAVEAPAVSLRAGYDVIEGTLQHGTPRHRVVVVIDGGITRTATVSADGTWQIDISDLPDGTHSYVAQAWWGTHSKSATVSGSWDTIASSRLFGGDRYDTAVAISQEAFPDGARIAFVASGENYPDALSAGPVAAKKGGPLLLSAGNALPGSVLSELQRLNPDQIVIVGGTSVISPAVMASLQSVAPTTRVAGADRYETSRKVAEYGFDATDRAFVATGRHFADALSASAAAASLGVPVVLVDGLAPALDSATEQLLRDWSVDEVAIAGGTGVVSAGVESGLGGLATTQRLAGVDRYETSVAINQYAHTDSSVAYIALGTNFPDGLTGSVLAGMRHAPMYITPGECVPSNVVDHARGIGVTQITLFGGPAVLTDRVATFARC